MMSSERQPKSARKVRHIGKGGTIAIPADLRDRLGLHEGTAVVLEERDGGLLLRSTEAAQRAEEAARQHEAERAKLWNEMDAAYARLSAGPIEGQSEKAWASEMLAQSNAAWDELMIDPETRRHIEEEDALWECTLMDGLDPDEVWTESDVIQQ